MKTTVKLIDLKAEYAIASENVELYREIQKEFVSIMQRQPNLNVEFVLSAVCEKADMKREEFNFINNIEMQHFKDMMHVQRRKK